MTPLEEAASRLAAARDALARTGQRYRLAQGEREMAVKAAKAAGMGREEIARILRVTPAVVTRLDQR